MNAIHPTVAAGLLRRLSGFKGYPRGDGEGRFVDALCEISLSVEHASAIVASFEDQFPTIREMRDTAFGLRPRFEVTVDQRREWEAQYGPPDTAFSRRIRGAAGVDHVHARRAVLWQAIRDGIFYTETSMGRADLSRIDDDRERVKTFEFWKEAALNNQQNYSSEVQSFRAELDKSNWDSLMAYDWARGDWPPAALRPMVPVAPVAPVARPITAEDVNRELRAQGRDSGDGE